jgi:hypothetical protein
MNLVLFDNFFKDQYSVDSVREFGLSQFIDKDLINDDVENYPGIRSELLHIINPKLHEYIKFKVIEPILSFSEYKENFKDKCELTIRYHLTTSIHECGLIHRDSNWNENNSENLTFSGVIYLNPNPPKNSGTKLFRKNCLNKPGVPSSKFFSFTTKNKDIILSFNKEKIEYNTKYFDFEYEVQNGYNSAVIYPGHYYHAPDQYFGEGLEDSRLVIVFFVKFID